MSRPTIAGAVASCVLLVTLSACGGAATPAPAASSVAAAPSVAAPSAAAPSVAAPSAAAPSVAPTTSEPSIAIPSFALPSEAKDLEALLPDTLCGAKALKASMSGTSFAKTADQQFLDALKAVGKTPADVAFAIAAGADSGCTAGIFRVQGADANALKTAMLAAAAKSSGTPTQKSVGGKDVYVTTESDSTSYVYFHGDAAIFVGAKTESDAAGILQQLP